MNDSGLYQTVSNRFNIPNPGGSRIWVSNEHLLPYLRIQGTFQVSERGYVRLMFAPLSATYSFLTGAPLVYGSRIIPGGNVATVNYKFNSYRTGYLYRLLSSRDLNVTGGFVGKVRQAKIDVSGGGVSEEYRNVGFVPLLNFGAVWNLIGPWSLRLDVDGAAARQGRAFDGALEVFCGLNKYGSGVSAGVRVLEGGADNSKVNTFALFQYAFVALTLGF